MYGGICTINYYVKALSVIYERVGKVYLFYILVMIQIG